jgi:imidazolonepropionase-like amidohydrolase
MIEVLQGKQVGLLALAGAAEFLHAAALFEKEKGFRPTLIMVPQGFRSPMDAWRVVDQLKGLKVPVILAPQVDRVPRTATRRLTQNVLIDAGVPVALVPDPSSGDEGLESLVFQLADLVRHGCREDQVLRAVTLTPAEILGIQGRCGSLEVGKDADILLFSGDPLVPTSALERVIIDGRTVYQRSEKKP